MISFRSFCGLKRGDVVLWHGEPRVVQWGPANDGPPPKRRGHAHIQFCRWATTHWPSNASPVAHYCYNDVKDKIGLPKKRRRVRALFEDEKDWLRSLGYNLRDAAAVVKRHERMAKREVTERALLRLEKCSPRRRTDR